MCNKANAEIKWNNNNNSDNDKLNELKRRQKKRRRVLKSRWYKQKTNSQRVDLKLIIPIIISNANGLNAPMKKQSLSDWIKKK